MSLHFLTDDELVRTVLARGPETQAEEILALRLEYLLDLEPLIDVLAKFNLETSDAKRLYQEIEALFAKISALEARNAELERQQA